MRLPYININLSTPRLVVIKAGTYYYKTYQVCLKTINLWENKKEIKNIFYGIEGIDKSFILRMPSLAKKGILINTIILLWR